MRVYLGGSIRGLSYIEANGWRKDAEVWLERHGFTTVNPLRGRAFLEGKGIINGADEGTPLTSSKGIVGRDLFDLTQCDVMLANLAGATAAGIGTAMEIQRAHDLGKYVMVVMEPGSINDHPFIREAASLVVDNIEEALKILRILGEPYYE